MTSPIIKAMEGVEPVAYGRMAENAPRLMSYDGCPDVHFEPSAAYSVRLYTADQFAAAYERLIAPSDAGVAHHAALQRIGTVLDLLPGSDLHTECVPAIQALRAQAGVAQGLHEAQGIDPLSEFQEGQWWVKELDEMVKDGATPDQYRAVAVVHHMLKSAKAALSAYERSAKVEDERIIGTFDNADDLIAALKADEPVSANAGAQAVDAAAQERNRIADSLNKKADDFAREHGYEDMGSLSFGRGPHAEYRREHHSFLIELAEELRAESLKQPADRSDP